MNAEARPALSKHNANIHAISYSVSFSMKYSCTTPTPIHIIDWIDTLPGIFIIIHFHSTSQGKSMNKNKTIKNGVGPTNGKKIFHPNEIKQTKNVKTMKFTLFK